MSNNKLPYESSPSIVAVEVIEVIYESVLCTSSTLGVEQLQDDGNFTW